MSPESPHTRSLFGHTIDDETYEDIQTRIDKINPILHAHGITLHWNRLAITHFPLELNSFGISRDSVEIAQEHARATIKKLWEEDKLHGQYTVDWNQAQTEQRIFEFELAYLAYSVDKRQITMRQNRLDQNRGCLSLLSLFHITG